MADQPKRKSSLGNSLLIAGGLLALYFASKFYFGSKLQVAFKSIGVSGNLLSPVLQLTFTLYNPTSVYSTLSNITGNLILDGNVIGNVMSLQKVNVYANTQQDINIDVTPSFIGIGETLINLLKTGLGNSTITFQGYITVDGFQLPTSTTYSI